MKNFIKILCFISLVGLCSCNTMGGLGRDVSEAGKALDDAAGWSQDQINSVASSSDDSSMSGSSEEIFQ